MIRVMLQACDHAIVPVLYDTINEVLILHLPNSAAHESFRHCWRWMDIIGMCLHFYPSYTRLQSRSKSVCHNWRRMKRRSERGG